MTEEEDTEDRQDIVLEQTGGILSNAPWWLVSAGIHAVLILGATLVAIEHLEAVEKGPTEIKVTQTALPVIYEMEKPRDVFNRAGLPIDDPTPSKNDEPIIFFPEAKESDHNESANEQDYKQMMGDSKNFLSYTPGEAGGFRGRQAGKTAGVYDTMGVGGGAGGGGRYGGRFGGRENLVKKGGGGAVTESSVLAVLRWLARHQGPDGGWAAEGFHAQCKGSRCGGIGERDYDAGVTGLSILAFLGAGYSQISKDIKFDPAFPDQPLDFGQVVKKGLQ